MDPVKLAVAIVVMSPALWFVFLAVRGFYRYYRDNRPTRMATRINARPFDDDRSSQRNFKRIMRS